MANADLRESGKKRKRAKEEYSGAGDELETMPKNLPLCSVWKDLDVILSLQDKAVPISRKIELAFELISADRSGDNRVFAPVQQSRVASFLGDWAQLLLISTDQGSRKFSDSTDACLDHRLWVVFKFCLEKSTINLSQNLLRPVTHVLIHMVSLLDRQDSLTAEQSSTGFCRAISECLFLVFSSYGRIFNAACADLWISCIHVAVGLMLKILSSVKDAVCNNEVMLHLSLFLLEQFASFLRFHPNPKNIFRSFVDRLLEKLLELLTFLQLQGGDEKCGFAGKLLRAVEDVLTYGLFHSAHMDGFSCTRPSSMKAEFQELKHHNQSYHKHFFKMIQRLISEKKVSVMGGFGTLLRLFVTSARKKKWRVVPEHFKARNKIGKDHISTENENETNMPLFEVFIQFTEPLILECTRYSEMDFSGATELREMKLLEIHCILRTLNDIFRTVMHERMYERTQDSPEGTHFCVLKKIYDAIIGILRKIYVSWLSLFDVHEEALEMLPFIAKEHIVSIGYFLEIEYRVIGDDLAGIWFMMLSYLSIHLSTTGSIKTSLLIKEILRTGHLMIDMYSELRQACKPIFALCKAVRFFGFSDKGGENDYLAFFPITHVSSDACTRAVMTLLCSQDLRSALSNAIKSIPEGQSSGCVQQVKFDFTESLEWIKASIMRFDGAHCPSLHHEYELFGGLSEVYSSVLESLAVTASNSISVGTCIDDSMTAMRLIFSSIVQNQSTIFDDFYISFTGKKISHHMLPNSSGLPGSFWVFVVFFRMYVSCRSLYLKAIGLMPTDSSRKAASSVGNFLGMSSGMDWERVADWIDGGYFSWVVKPSISLLVLIQSISNTFLMDNATFCAPLTFMLHVMALQRLTDLNQRIRSLQYLLDRGLRLADVQVTEGNEYMPSKKHKMLKRLLKVARQEATDLTNFMAEHLSLVTSIGQKKAFHVIQAVEDSNVLSDVEDAWNMSVCSLNQNSLPVAIWWLLCQNIDLWCVHASKKSLKEFSSHLIYFAIFSFRSCPVVNTVKKSLEPPTQGKVVARQVSINLLQNMILFEQSVLSRYLTTSLTLLLKKLVIAAFGRKIHFSSLPDWSEILSSLDKMSFPHTVVGCPSDNNSTMRLLHLISSDRMHPEDCTWRKFSSTTLDVGACERLLILLCKLLKVHGELRSFSSILPYVLNLEWLVFLILLSCCCKFSYSLCDTLSLFLSCRRTLRCLLEAAGEDNKRINSSYSHVILCPNYIRWLLKSATEVGKLSHAHFDSEHCKELTKMLFALMDHTSYIFFAVSKVQLNEVINLIFRSRDLHFKHSMLDVRKENDSVSDFELLSDSFGVIIDEWKCLKVAASSLEKEAEAVLLLIRSMHTEGHEASVCDVGWKNLSNVLSCFQGFLWGIVSAVDNVDRKHLNEKALKLIITCISELFSCITVFDEIINCCLKLPQMKCENPEASFTIRQVFMSAAAILKLRHFLSVLKVKKVENGCEYMQSSATQILVSTTDSMLSEMADSARAPQHSDLLWIDGVLKYLEVLSSCFPITNSVLSENMYTAMITMHLKAIGKCICLQGKVATLSSHDMGSYTKLFRSEIEKDGNTIHLLDDWENKIYGLKARLRMSFKKLIRRQLQSDLVPVVKALDRVIVGVQQGCIMVSQIKICNKDGGKVSAIVPAAIDCFDLIFDSFSGHNLLCIIRSCIQNFVGSLFNIILHLQTPSIFFKKHLSSDKNKRDPDPGSTILMCIEMLTKLVRKHSQLKMDPCNVGHALHVPATLFKHYCKLKSSHVLSYDRSFMHNEAGTSAESMHDFVVDHQFSVDLYAACCGLLCSILRHQTRETVHCISLLEDSLKVLLTCLESKDADLVSEKNFVLTTVEKVKCASFLRRVYEEVQQQKEVVGIYSSYLLCDYIYVYSGYGILGTGFKREVDEALRQGIYSLIDMCSADDFQNLHTILGEGPCRRALATLHQDYQLHFQYQGKI